jgi:hypothetical protein
MTQEITIRHEGTDWEIMSIPRKWETWEIHQHNDGDVEISCEGSDGNAMLFLSQDELKVLIAFLQTKVK